MKNPTVPLLFVILVLTAGLVFVAACTWRLNSKAKHLESELQTLGTVRITQDAFWLAPDDKPPGDSWRLCVAPGALQKDTDLPEKVKQSLQALQEKAHAK